MRFRISARFLKRLLIAGAAVGGTGAVVFSVIPEVASRVQELENSYAKLAEKVGLDKRFSDPPTGSVMAFEDQRKYMYNPLPPRQDILKSLEEEEFDILVIGGGATGTGVALDAVTRGLKTGLVEKFDFASGTSSRSTKLIHGGVRYLQKAVFNLDIEQYRMVKEALTERANLLNIAPHLATPLPIMLPVYKWWQLPYFWAGIKMYDIVAGRQVLKPSYILSKNKALQLFPMLKRDKLVGALVYYDGQHDDARMNVALAVTAVRYGASVANYTEVVSLLKEVDSDGKERVTGAHVKDRLTGKEWDIKAKCVINATGPYTDRIRTMGQETVQQICQPSSGVHVVLPDYYSPESMGLLDPATSDGRVIFFLPWQNVTLAGTTDSPCKVSDYPQPTEEEIQFILKEIRNYLSPDVEVRRGDVMSAWSGIRPLVSDPNKADTQSIARNHIIEVADNKLITIAGGKWTTYRHMAEETVDRAVVVCNLEANRKCCTKGLLLDGAHGWSPTLFIRLVQDFGVENQVAQHLANTYGDKAFKVAKMCNLTGKRWPVLGKRLHEEYPYIEGEVKYAVREYACRAIDVLARRTRLAFANVHAAKEALPRIVDIMGQELGWNEERKKEELEHADLFLRREMGLDIKQTSENKLNFTKDEVNQYVKRFKSLDYQNKGFITVNDLRKYFKKMGEKVTEDQLHDILSEVDLNRNAQVDLGEFLQLVTALKKIANNDEEPNIKLRKLAAMLTSRITPASGDQELDAIPPKTVADMIEAELGPPPGTSIGRKPAAERKKAGTSVDEGGTVIEITGAGDSKEKEDTSVDEGVVTEEAGDAGVSEEAASAEEAPETEQAEEAVETEEPAEAETAEEAAPAEEPAEAEEAAPVEEPAEAETAEEAAPAEEPAEAEQAEEVVEAEKPSEAEEAAPAEEPAEAEEAAPAEEPAEAEEAAPVEEPAEAEQAEAAAPAEEPAEAEQVEEVVSAEEPAEAEEAAPADEPAEAEEAAPAEEPAEAEEAAPVEEAAEAEEAAPAEEPAEVEEVTAEAETAEETVEEGAEQAEEVVVLEEEVVVSEEVETVESEVVSAEVVDGSEEGEAGGDVAEEVVGDEEAEAAGDEEGAGTEEDAAAEEEAPPDVVEEVVEEDTGAGDDDIAEGSPEADEAEDVGEDEATEDDTVETPAAEGDEAPEDETEEPQEEEEEAEG